MTEIATIEPMTLAPRQSTDPATAALAARAEAEVKARFVVALSRPRDPAQVRHRLLQAAKRPRFAEAALFSLPPRGEGGRIEGLSIRAAEEILREWGNMTARDEVISDDEHSRTVRVEVIDLETNASTSRDVQIEKRIERRKLRRDRKTQQVTDTVLSERTTSTGEKVYTVRPSDDELITRQNSLVSKALRVCVLRMVPADLQEDLIDQVRASRSTSEARDPAAAAKALSDWFGSKLQISPAELAAYLGHSVATATREELRELRDIGTAIIEGHTTWADVASGREPAAPAQAAPAPASPSPSPAKRASKRAPEPEPAPAPAQVEIAQAPAGDLAAARDRVIRVLAADGLSAADADHEINNRWPNGPTAADLIAWADAGCA